MAESLGTAVLTLDADGSGLQNVLTATESGVLGKFKSMAGSTKNMIGLALGTIAGLAIGTGKALYDIGEQFDDAYDKIQTGTGATGKQLEALKDDFRNVVSSVPTDFDSASTAISEINRRLGLTGKPLQQSAKQFLELSRITGTDLKTNIESVSKAFVDWEVPVKDQQATLDGFFRLSQKTGIGVDELATSVQQFGSPLRTLGFSLDESASMFAMFEKAGVNTQTMVPGLKLAIGNLVDPTDELKSSFERLGVDAKKPHDQLMQIFDLLSGNGLSTTEKMSFAMQVFGKRAGADMAEAIKQGRFEVGDLMKVMDKGKDTIRGAGRDTMDFSEQWQLFKNKAMVALEPVAARVFASLGDGMKWLNKNWPEIMKNVVAATDWLKQAWKDIEPLVSLVVKQVSGQLNDFKGAFKGFFDVVKGAVDIFVGAIHGDFGQMWDGIKSIFKGAVEAVIGIMKTLTAPMRDVAKAVGGHISDMVTSLANAVKPMVDAAKSIGSGIKTGFDKVTEIPGKLAGALGHGLDRIQAFLEKYRTKALLLGKQIVSKLGDGISGLVSKLGGVLDKGVDKLVEFIEKFGAKALNIGEKIVNRIINGIGNIGQSLSDKLQAGVDKVTEFVDKFGTEAEKIGGKIVDKIVGGIKGLPDAVKTALTGVAGIASSIGRALGDWINANTLFGDHIHIGVPGPVPDVNFDIPSFAAGVQNFAGGWALVGEEGPELARLPGGTDVFPNRKSASMLSDAGGDNYFDIFIGGEKIAEHVRAEIRSSNRATARQVARRTPTRIGA